MAAINIVDRVQAIQYTGSNSTEIDAAITNLTIVSETGGVLTVESPPNNGIYVLNTGDWARFAQGAIYSVHPNTDFLSFYVRNAVFDEVAAIGSAAVRSVGAKEAPTLILGQSTVVPVDIIPAMPDTSYTVDAQLFGPASALGSLSITGTSIVDSNTVDVTVQNSGIVSLNGIHILVIVKD